jgi:hypothetical protein
MTPVEQAGRLAVKHYLESYHYIKRQKYVDNIAQDKTRLFLDSGAFSAFTQGAEVDLPGYCDYIKRNKHIIVEEDGQLLASVLDNIKSPEKTLENQRAMEALGVRPLPCFHYGEDPKYLEYYMKNYPYVTIGGMVPISNGDLKIWLDELWTYYLMDSSGHAKTKIHGFGLTSLELIKRYPWYSVDSSSWVQSAATGSIYLPGYTDTMVCVSAHSPSRHEKYRHADTMMGAGGLGDKWYDSVHYKSIAEFISTIKFPIKHIDGSVTMESYDMTRLKETYLARWSFNCWAFTEINRIADAHNPDAVFTQGGVIGACQMTLGLPVVA